MKSGIPDVCSSVPSDFWVASSIHAFVPIDENHEVLHTMGMSLKGAGSCLVRSVNVYRIFASITDLVILR